MLDVVATEDALRVLARARCRSAAEVEELHELLCFLRAYPDDPEVLELAERQLLVECFHRHAGNNSAMARELGVARSTLHYKLKRFGIGS